MRKAAERATVKRLELGKPAGGSRRKAELGDVAKWGLADAAQFGQVLLQYQQDLDSLKGLREKQTHALRSLQTNMLKGMFFSKQLSLSQPSAQLERGKRRSAVSTRPRTITNSQRC